MYVELIFQVGGPGFSKVIKLMNTNGRAAICGAIATYNSKEPVLSMSNYMSCFYITTGYNFLALNRST